MPHITVCSNCCTIYEASSEETANEPNRLCPMCVCLAPDCRRLRRNYRDHCGRKACAAAVNRQTERNPR